MEEESLTAEESVRSKSRSPIMRRGYGAKQKQKFAKWKAPGEIPPTLWSRVLPERGGTRRRNPQKGERRKVPGENPSQKAN